ncbi:MAG: hypothetical protein ACRYFS_21040 [Janthinobacterium lividum]
MEGYLVALMTRSARTLLLEGESDKIIVSRVIRELEEEGSVAKKTTVIDTAELIKVSSRTIGNREKVEEAHAEATNEGISLAALVDREFREFQTDVLVEDRLRSHKVVPPNLFWTRGHSIENYFFEISYFIENLKLHFSEDLTPGMLELVKQNFPSIILESAAISLSAYKTGLIGRSDKLIRKEWWKRDNQTEMSISFPHLSSGLISRGATQIQATEMEEASVIFKQRLLTSDVHLRKWIAHGHLGTDLLWTGIAKLLEEEGCSQKSVEQVAYGQNAGKLRCASSSWANSIIKETTESPTALWQWYMVDK